MRERAPGFAKEVKWRPGANAFCSAARRWKRWGKSKEVAPEAVVIVGNDQREFFNEGPDSCDHGLSRQADQERPSTCTRTHLGLNIASAWQRSGRGARCIRARPDLADHILIRGPADNFDLAQSDLTSKSAPRGRDSPSGYGSLYHSILGDVPPPSVPIILNVHFPHNVPKNHRCLELGRALRRAISRAPTGFYSPVHSWRRAGSRIV